MSASSCPLRMSCIGKWPCVQSRRSMSCCASISSEKKATGKERGRLVAALSASERAKAVLPMPGRAARMISSPSWSPVVRLSSREKPVTVPLTASCARYFSIRSMVSTRRSFVGRSPRVTCSRAMSEIRCCVSASTSRATAPALCALKIDSLSARMTARSSDFSWTVFAWCVRAAVLETSATRACRYSSPPHMLSWSRSWSRPETAIRSEG